MIADVRMLHKFECAKSAWSKSVSKGTIRDMSETYSKLFSSITDSTIWAEPNETRILWITMLAMADRHGYVGASIPGLAARARITIEQCEKGLQTFMSPDPYSRSSEHEGRRIEIADRGWILLNYERFRDMRDEEARKEYERIRKRKQRGKKCPEMSQLSRDVPKSPAVSAQAYADTYTDPEKKRHSAAQAHRLTLTELPDEWIAWARNEGRVIGCHTWDTFRDYWQAVPGSKGTKLDWFATWRNWVRREDSNGNRKAGRGNSAADRVRAANATEADPEIDRYF